MGNSGCLRQPIKNRHAGSKTPRRVIWEQGSREGSASRRAVVEHWECSSLSLSLFPSPGVPSPAAPVAGSRWSGWAVPAPAFPGISLLQGLWKASLALPSRCNPLGIPEDAGCKTGVLHLEKNRKGQLCLHFSLDPHTLQQIRFPCLIGCCSFSPLHYLLPHLEFISIWFNRVRLVKFQTVTRSERELLPRFARTSTLP